MINTAYTDIALLEEVGSCLLCCDAPCTKACPYGVNPADVIPRRGLKTFRARSISCPKSCRASPARRGPACQPASRENQRARADRRYPHAAVPAGLKRP